MGLAADFVLIVVAGLAGGILARLLRLPLLVGYVFAGILVGPHTAGPTVVQVHDIETLAEIGVALLLFSIGLEISFRDLEPVKRVALFGGPVQILLTMAGGSWLAHTGLGFGWIESIWFGAMASVSSTMVVLKVLAASGVTSTLASRVMIGLLLVQDLAVVPMLIILPRLGQTEGGIAPIATALATAAALLVAVYLLGARLLPPLFRRILTWGSRELFLVAVVATGVGIGAAMHAAGFSFALGAFVAGLILSESEFSHQALSDLVPLRDIFGLLFFVTVGMLFDPAYAIANAGLILAVVALILAGKALLLGLIARAFGYRFMAPWIIGLGLSQIGEFSFVLARSGLSSGAITEPLYHLSLTATVLTMAVAPLVSGAALPLGRWWKRWLGSGDGAAVPAQGDAVHAGHVIVGGYGRTGRAVARALRLAGIPYLVVESSYSLVADLRDNGHPGLFGDLTREEILHAARAAEARMLILTMPGASALEQVIELARRVNPGIPILGRASRIESFRKLQAAGVWAVQPEFEGGLELAHQGLRRLGLDDEECARVVGSLRSQAYGESAA